MNRRTLISSFVIIGCLRFNYTFHASDEFISTNVTNVVENSVANANLLEPEMFDHDQIPEHSVVDMNVGTNLDPLKAMEGRYRILVDPLFYVCDSNAKLAYVTAFCFAVSNYTGFSTFYEYNKKGLSSSLSQVTAGTSHEKFAVKYKRTVLVLEASVLFEAIYNKNTIVHRLKLDMQGHELTTLSNMLALLKKDNFIKHIKAECFCPNKEGKQIYQLDNSCEKVAQVLEEAGYATQWACGGEFSDVIATKIGAATMNFIPSSDWDGLDNES